MASPGIVQTARQRRKLLIAVSLLLFAVTSVLWATRKVRNFTGLGLRFLGSQFSSDVTDSAQPSEVNTASYSTDPAFTNSFDPQGLGRTDCSVPEFDLDDPEVKTIIKKLKPHACSREPKLTTVQGEALVLNTSWLLAREQTLRRCTYEVIKRVSENEVSYADPVEFTAVVRPYADFVRVICKLLSSSKKNQTYKALHALVLEKPELERRLNERLLQRLRNRTSTEKNETEDPSYMNVVMIGVDTVSRFNMMRHMTRTRHFLLDNMGAVELTNYNKVGINTFYNIMPMTSGNEVENGGSLKQGSYEKSFFDDLDIRFLWDEFAQQGYRTLYAEDHPGISIFNYEKKGFKRAPAHYYNRPMEIAKERDGSLFSDSRHCFGGEPQDELILKYSLAFQRLFRDRPHFAFTFLTGSTHGSDLNSPSQVDDYHARHLSSLAEEGLLNNTLLIFFSDHGIRWGEFRSTPLGKLEDVRPFMFLVFPEWFRTNHRDKMQRVQQNAARLTTPTDIYATLLDALYLNGSDPFLHKRPKHHGVSLFDEIPENRSCEQAGIPPPYCVCLNERPLNTSSALAKEAGEALVGKLNAVLEHVRTECHVLQLHDVIEAAEVDEGAQYNWYAKTNCQRTNTPTSLYRVVVETRPGNGRFEALLSRCDTSSKLEQQGQINRLTMYGDTSSCVSGRREREMCYCKSGSMSRGSTSFSTTYR